jgi:hypothetical protein
VVTDDQAAANKLGVEAVAGTEQLQQARQTETKPVGDAWNPGLPSDRSRPKNEASPHAYSTPRSSAADPSAAQSYGQGLPPAGGWKRYMPEPKVEHTHGPFAGPYSSCPACSAAMDHGA